jgi:hypothetical protein
MLEAACILAYACMHAATPAVQLVTDLLSATCRPGLVIAWSCHSRFLYKGSREQRIRTATPGKE